MKRADQWLTGFCALWFAYAVNAALPTNWNVRTSPSLDKLNGAAYGNGLFVAVGENATILTSPSGINWTAQTAGTNSASLYCAAYGNNLYVLGGGNQNALILVSSDAVHWTNDAVPIGAGTIYGVAYAYGQFVAVGRGASGACILTSSNGLDWLSRSAPSTNTLLTVSPPASADGTGWADYLYVAVGEQGTILTSTNGVNWALANSGTTAALRSIAWQGALLAGGDSGVRVSADATVWYAGAPPSFNIRGLASSFNQGAVVAVGNYTTSGRIHASTDGLTWPGFAQEFSQPLNAVAYGGNSFVAVGDGGLILQAVLAPLSVTNEWTRLTSGSWEEMYWSLGVLPSADQQTVAFRNPGWKALAVGANTAANFPGSMTVNDLIIDAPVDSANQLLLNWAGLTTPLVVRSNLVIGTNGSLAAHYSALDVANFDLQGAATFSDNAIADVSRLSLRLGATLSLADASLSFSNVSFFDGTFSQSGGNSYVQTMILPEEPPWVENFEATNLLSGGTLVSGSVEIGWPTPTTQGFGYFTQSGGTHTNSILTLWGYTRTQSAHFVGFYTLNAGLLASRNVALYTGKFVQNGGSNFIDELTIQWAGNFSLQGGELVTSNVTLSIPGGIEEIFTQTGGVHTVQNRLLLDGSGISLPYYLVQYSLKGGLLSAQTIDVRGAALGLRHGAVSNGGSLVLSSGGALLAGPINNDFGLLQISNAVTYPVFLDVEPFLFDPGPTVLRFRDSHNVPWSGSLQIHHWKPGAEHIFIGTNSQGLTSAQLSQVSFINPLGWPTGPYGMPTNYPATILSSGELVPGMPPPLGYTNVHNALMLSWPDGYELLTATNVSGPYEAIPGATSPRTNSFTDPQRYFRLRLPAP